MLNSLCVCQAPKVTPVTCLWYVFRRLMLRIFRVVGRQGETPATKRFNFFEN